MNVVLALVRADLRRSWRQLLGVALVVAVGSGTVMLAMAGARRADTSFERFRTSVVDGQVFAGIQDAPTRLEELADLPTVQVLAPFGYVPIVPRGAPEEAGIEGGGFASIDGRWLYDVQRPRVLDGHMPDPDAPRQMAVNEVFAREFDAKPGDVLAMEAVTDAAMEGTGEQGEVTVDVEVAAIVRTPLDIGVNVGGPIVYLPPGFLRAHPEIGVVRGFGLVRLVGGDGAFPEFQQQAATLFDGEPSFTVSLITAEGRDVRQALDVQVTALLIVALVAAVSAAALLTQVVARGVRRAADATAALRSIGASGPQRTAILAGPPIAVITLAAVVAAAGAALLSPVLPRGLARVAEPDPGLYADGTVLALVGLASVLLAATLVLAIAVRATRTIEPGPQDTPGLGERTLQWLQSAGARLPVVTGLRLALPSRRDGKRLAGLASLAGLVVGVAGLIATSAFGTRLSDAVESDSAWGAPFDLFVDLGRGGSPVEAAAIPGVHDVTVVHYVEALDLGEVTAPGFGVRAEVGELAVTTLEGRVPAAVDEALLGARTAERLDLRIGDRISLPAKRGAPIELSIVGHGLVPIVGDGSYDAGIVVLEDTFDRLDAAEPDVSLWVGLTTSADAEAVTSALREQGAGVGPIEPPSEQRNLRSTLGYPSVVGMLFGLLALAGVGNALLSGAAARRLELATLRAIGFTGRQVREAVFWQAFLTGLIGLLLAVPLGFAVTNTAWGVFADTLSLDRSLGLPWGVASAAALGLLVVAGAAAVPIGRAWARRTLILDLRAE